MLTDKEFCNVPKSGSATGFQLKVKIPYYRGVFLSMLHDIRVTVDGALFGPEKVKIAVDGRAYTMAEAKQEPNVHWDFGKWATLIVSKPGGLAPGVHTVEVGILTRTSYDLPPSMDPKGIFKQQGGGEHTPMPTTDAERYRYTVTSPGAGRVVRKMTISQ